MTEIREYCNWKLRSVKVDRFKGLLNEVMHFYENVWFWAYFAVFGLMIAILAKSIVLFAGNLALVLICYFYVDYRSGKWRGEIRNGYKEIAKNEMEENKNV